MLSYQHSYHAGSRADIHKHNLLAHVLGGLCKGAPVTYIETHAGRGVYDTQSKESVKTGEAADGWEKLVKHKAALAQFAPAYVDAVRALNKGKLSPRYPGSPCVAAHVLRKQDKIHLMELHPAEFAALKKNMGRDARVKVHKKDGLEGAYALAEKQSGRGLVLIDPSYEVKAEYEMIPAFVGDLHVAWPEAAILIWAPMLPAMRHEELVSGVRKAVRGAQISTAAWAKPGSVRGMYGSIMVGINAGPGFKNDAAGLISKL